MAVNQSSQDNYISEQDYLTGEQKADTRQEYDDGKVYAMAGASKRHNRIARNLITNMADAADRSNCETYFSDIKVRAEKYKTYYYPDVVVSCEEDDDSEYYLEKPCLIVEVTSASTLRKDYLEKALSYQSIDSLQAYLIIAQDKPQIDMLFRGEDRSWRLQQFNQFDDELVLPCPDMRLTLQAIYSGIEFDAPWDDFFNSKDQASEDFMADRVDPPAQEREPF